MPTANGCVRRRREQKPWIVEIHAPSSLRARSARPRPWSAARMRARSSPAAFRVYVITSTDSTSSPCSQTARTKRSTSTLVLPVPAPAETKTSPFASTAACCCSFTSSSFHPADRPEVAPRRAGAAAWVVRHVTRADTLAQIVRKRPRAFEALEELLVVEIVRAREARELLLRARPQQPARLPFP